MPKQSNSLSLVYLEDDENMAKAFESIVQGRLNDRLLPGKDIAIATAYSEQKAIDAISVLEGKGFFVSDLQIGKEYPVKAWKYASEQSVPMVLLSNNDLEEDHETWLRDLKRQFPNFLRSMTKYGDWYKSLPELIVKTYPDFFKKEREARDTDFGKGSRK